MRSSIILGTQFGDEAKGSFVNYLCSNVIEHNIKPIVVRFNGGHQAGHTVLHNGITPLRMARISQSYNHSWFTKIYDFSAGKVCV